MIVTSIDRLCVLGVFYVLFLLSREFLQMADNKEEKETDQDGLEVMDRVRVYNTKLPRCIHFETLYVSIAELLTQIEISRRC